MNSARAAKADATLLRSTDSALPPAQVPSRLGHAIPTAVLALFAIDLLLGVAGLLQFELRERVRSSLLFVLFSLGGERNVGTWYSSLQLALSGVLLLTLAAVMTERAQARGSQLWLWLPAAFFLALSADEALELHEWIANAIYSRVPQLSHSSALFHKTGLWMVVLVPVFLAVLFVVARAARPLWVGRPGVIRLYLAGFAVLLGGAAGIELFGNFTPRGRMENFIVTLEELGEMAGGTLLLWANLALLRSHGLWLSFSPPPPLESR